MRKNVVLVFLVTFLVMVTIAVTVISSRQMSNRENTNISRQTTLFPNLRGLYRVVPTDQKGKVRSDKSQFEDIKTLMSCDVRILGMERVPTIPPQVFVLHQPTSSNAQSSELTLLRFKNNGVDRLDLGSYCFMPELLTAADGRVFVSWEDTNFGGNSWSSRSLETRIITDGKCITPEMKLKSCQVPKEIVLDGNTPVLIVWDSRFEYFAGLSRVESPLQQSIFELNSHNVWFDATKKHRWLLQKWIIGEEAVLEEARQQHDTAGITKAALNIYLNAEAGGFADKYRLEVKRILNENSQQHFVRMIDEAVRRQVRLADLVVECR